MKKCGIILGVLFSVALLFGQNTERHKVGVVLCGGGAKGFAHVGALQILEQAGIPIDMIGGTSIGSIVGSLYACGYSAAELEQICRSQTWEKIISDDIPRRYIEFHEKDQLERYVLGFPLVSGKPQLPLALLNGQNVINLFCDYMLDFHTVENFRNLPIPFFCVATDMETGNEVVLDHGFLPEAVLASMAIPGVFKPVIIENRVLSDGGVVNNMPVDKMKEFGADIIIAIDIAQSLYKNDELVSIGNIVNQLAMFLDYGRMTKNREMADLIIRPDITGYSAASFTVKAVDTLIVRGREAALATLDELEAIKKQHHLGTPTPRKSPMPNIDNPIPVKKIRVDGNKRSEEQHLANYFAPATLENITRDEIGHNIQHLYGQRNFDRIYYHYDNRNEGLTLKVIEKNTNALNLGFRYDTVSRAALLVNWTLRNSYNNFNRLTFDAWFSVHPGAKITGIIGWKQLPMLSTSLSVRNWNHKLYHDGSKIGVMDVDNFTFNAHLFKNFRNGLQYGFGTEIVHFDGDYLGDLPVAANSTMRFISNWNYNYYGYLNIDLRDSSIFPKSGFKLDATYWLITDDGFHVKDKSPIHAITAGAEFIIPLHRRTHFIPGAHFSTISKTSQTSLVQNLIGGNATPPVMMTHMPFVGINELSLALNNILIGSAKLRYYLLNQHYLTLTFNMGLQSPEQLEFKFDDPLYGIGLTYSYDSPVGPIEASLSKSNTAEDVLAYFSFGYRF